MAEAARMVEESGADLVDLNFGCPVKKVTKTGAGATLLEDPALACRIVEAIVAHVSPTPDVRRVPLEEAQTRLGPYALALALDQVVRSPRAHALGWAPELKSIAGNVARLFEEWRADSAARAQEATGGPPEPDRPAATRSRRRSRPAK